jgi:hypothetical protein
VLWEREIEEKSKKKRKEKARNVGGNTHELRDTCVRLAKESTQLGMRP